MRLKKIKLAGFKSFVDAISIQFPSNLVGVVGPNGCGKSNIIDAVRWVMGESSAKHLRSDSMAEVIFNGSSARQAVGQAMVELLFDNSAGKLGGEYAQYDEIAIKRVVTRDGQSSYYLNNSRCRRKDITGIFLGTGLGPRSYAIIEQGTISRLIEAKPDDLRIYLEEAAGISKYKERRRETESRMQHTRDNLEHLNVIRVELDKQLERLKRQARAAERYKTLKQDERTLKAQLQAIRYTRLQEKSAQHEQHIKQQQVELERYSAQLRSLEQQSETQRAAQVSAQETVDSIQARYYAINTQIARLEESINQQKQRCTELQQDVQQIAADLQLASTHLAEDQKQREQLLTEREQLAPELERATAQMNEAQQQLNHLESERQTLQEQWDYFNEQALETSKKAHSEQTQIQYLEEKIKHLEQQIQRLEQEQAQIDFATLAQRLADFKTQQQSARAKVLQAEQDLLASCDEIKLLRADEQSTTQAMNQLNQQLHTSTGRQASLQALQQAALHKDDKHIINWLTQHDLHELPRLAEQLIVEPGWECAVETVLGHYLQAVCVDQLSSITALLATIPAGELVFLANTQTHTSAQEKSLASKITHLPMALQQQLQTIFIADDLPSAEQLLATLKADESVITAAGIWLSHDCLRVDKRKDKAQSVLANEQELRQLNQQIKKLTAQLQEYEQRQAGTREQLSELDDKREQLQTQLNELNAHKATLDAKFQADQQHHDELRNRSQYLEQNLAEQQQQLVLNKEHLTRAREHWHEAMSMMDSDADKRDSLLTKRQTLADQLQQLRATSQERRESAHQLQLRHEALESQLVATTQNFQRLQQRLAQLNERKQTLTQTLTELSSPQTTTQTELEQQLTHHQAVAKELQAARDSHATIESNITELHTQHTNVTQEHHAIESKINQLQIDAQETRVRAQTIVEQAEQEDYSLQQTIQDLPEQYDLTQMQEELTTVTQKIQRLGAINLVAIDEYETESERKAYLDSQYNDLIDALSILENAISRIDTETRGRFKETYETVNQLFKELFPRLFGGGQAYLELTGQDLLATGVHVIARPPGKRNSSIHQLSGGEKALTAVALVFAIFHLNPSPFCMLDEVDAPLDDTNVGRFCELVKSMADKIQFIFITHNKVTMEMAGHLSGVTMHEPGVSRMVSVDVEQAVSMAE